MSRSFVIWLTGLSGAGKSTLGYSMKEKLKSVGKNVILIDADEVRKGICKDLGFSNKDKTENIRRIAEISKICFDEELIPIVASISPFKNGRDYARKIIEKKGSFYEIYVKASLKEVMRRDTKGLYKKFNNGKVRDLSGVDSKYEIPEKPEIIIDTEKTSILDSINIIYDHIKKEL